MKVLNELNLEVREEVYMSGIGQWVWPKEDVRCWRYFNSGEKEYFKQQFNQSTSCQPYHLPHDILSLLPDNKRNLVFQAGGNGGLYPSIYSKFFKQVITFEPHVRWFACLSMNAPENNVFKYRAALGNDNDPVEIVIPNNNMGGMFVAPGGSIPKLKLDAFNLIPDLIHLDIEGAELSALEGATETIKRAKPMIVVEWDWATMKQFGYDTQVFEQYFDSINYVLQKSWNRDRAYVHTSNYKPS